MTLPWSERHEGSRFRHRCFSAETVLLVSLAIVLLTTLRSVATVSQDSAPSPPGPGGTVWAPLQINDDPATKDICAAVIFDTPLLPISEPTAAQNHNLLKALQNFARRAVRDEFSSLTDFLESDPEGPWAVAVGTQLGREYYRVGRYSRAIACWKQIWDSNKSATEEVTVALSNRSASELAMMYG